jgi:hypothetical protein
VPVESASDLASMFDEDEWAVAASYQPPSGAAVACTVVVDRGQGRSPFQGGEQQLATSERKVWVRKAEIALLARGGVFTLDVDGEQLRVDDLPVLDHTGTLWSADLVIV